MSDTETAPKRQSVTIDADLVRRLRRINGALQLDSEDRISMVSHYDRAILSYVKREEKRLDISED